MSDVEKMVIPNTIENNFKTHLESFENKRILFSAPFGAGKSFFLENYFATKENTLSITLHPVDYSVASNEDIFELIKHDIINALIEKYSESIDLKKEDFSNLLLAQEFARNRMDFTGIGKAIISALIPKGESFVKVAEELKKINDDFNDFKVEFTDNQEKAIKDYLADLKNKKGSIRENDAITAIIKNFVKRIKDANNNKPFVFVLDDLDRLDPEHLFRLFNVFTAHNDSKTDNNKFDFDQLIFVCDIKNIHFMFQHKYGAKVDFSGYIDKFYSSHVFYFDAKKYFKEYIKRLILTKYNFGKEFTDNLPNQVHKRYDFKDIVEAQDGFSIMQHLINGMIDLDQIKIRSFERFQCYRVPNYKFDYRPHLQVFAYEYYFLMYTSILQQFFPRLHEYEEALIALSEKYIPDYDEDETRFYYENDDMDAWIIQIALPFIMPPALAFGNIQEQTNLCFEYSNENNKLMEIHYSVNYEGMIKYLFMKHSPVISDGVTDTESKLRIRRPNPYWFFLKAYQICLKKGFLRQ